MCNDLWILFFSLSLAAAIDCVCRAHNSQWNVCPALERMVAARTRALLAQHIPHLFIAVRTLFMNQLPLLLWQHDNLQKKKSSRRERCAKLNGEYTVKMALSECACAYSRATNAMFCLFSNMEVALFSF